MKRSSDRLLPLTFTNGQFSPQPVQQTCTVEVIEVPKKRKLYARRCCIPLCICCIICTVLLAIGIGLTVFFLYPRIPDLSIAFKSADIESINTNTFTLDLLINLNITLDNKNYVVLQANQVVVNVSTQSTKTLIGQATNQGVISFPSMIKESQIVPLNFVSEITSESVFVSIAEQCSAAGTKSLPVVLDGTYKVYYKGIAFGYPMTFSRDATIPCCFGSGC